LWAGAFDHGTVIDERIRADFNVSHDRRRRRNISPLTRCVAPCRSVRKALAALSLLGAARVDVLPGTNALEG
jgi:hypothetical protein